MDMKPRVQGRCPEWRPGSLLCSHYTDTWSWSSVQCRPGAESVSTNARWVSEKTKGGARGQAGPGSCWTGWSEVGVWGGGAWSNTWPQRDLHTRTTVVSSPSEQESSEPVRDSGPESTRWVTIIAVNLALPIAVGQEMF